MPAKASRGAVSRSSHSPRGREVLGIVLLAIGVFWATALLSWQFSDGRLMGPLGHACARLVYAIAGMSGHLVTAAMIVVPVRLLAGRPVVRNAGEAIGFLLGVVSVAVLLHLACGGYRDGGIASGGKIGEALAEVLRAAVSTAGTALVASLGVAIAAITTTGVRVVTVGRGLARAVRAGGRALRVVGRGLGAVLRALRFLAIEVYRFFAEVLRAILPERREDDEDDSEEPAFVDDRASIEETRAGGAETVRMEMSGMISEDGAPEAIDSGDTVRVGEPDMQAIIIEATKPKRGRKKKDALEPSPALDAATAAAAEPPAPTPTPIPTPESGIRTPDPDPRKPEPMIVESAFHKARKAEMKEKEKHVSENRPDFIPLGDGVYRLPPVSLLKYDDTAAPPSRDAMLELSARLVKTLADYGVRGEVTAIRPGPVVTMYEFAPAPGTRVSKITSLDSDLAMALEALSIRIVAPIPGKAAVGIEVPNKLRETVYLKEIIADDVFQRAKSKLCMALGKDIEGRPVAIDLAKMPHLLVAGTTGAGKSVSVNAMITSLLYNATPEEVRMIMVDPKMLELSIYEGIPHLLLPVVTDPKKANLALKWAVEEMERRYELLAEAGVRDIASYNRKVERKAQEGAEPVEVTIEDDKGNTVETTMVSSLAEAQAEGQLSLPAKAAAAPAKKLPYIVVVIDEFADLMMTAPKDVETSVARIAQKARAAGVHLLLATQRPSVDVITGLIKANFPSRIAFQVASKIDSRTILDQMGAEALLGQGDMLFSDRGGALRRVHGCLVQDEEIFAVVDFLKKQGKPIYDLEILRPREEDGGEEEGAEDFSDDLYDRAVALVAETRQASISMIQRRLRIGYNRAARMVERMEREGIVGPADGPNRREVLVSSQAV